MQQTLKTAALVALALVAGALGYRVVRLARLLARTERTRGFLESILDTITDPIFVKDREHR
jgi:hypothetical protein